MPAASSSSAKTGVTLAGSRWAVASARGAVTMTGSSGCARSAASEESARSEQSVAAVNIATHLRMALRGRQHTAFGSDLRLATPGGLYTYPDVTVVCRPPSSSRAGRTWSRIRLSSSRCSRRRPVTTVRVGARPLTPVPPQLLERVLLRADHLGVADVPVEGAESRVDDVSGDP